MEARLQLGEEQVEGHIHCSSKEYGNERRKRELYLEKKMRSKGDVCLFP